MNEMILVVSPEEACRMLNGDQSILVRKINPRKLPCECNIYCTKDKKGLIEKCLVKTPYKYEYTVRKVGKTILFENDETYNGKVIAKFTLNKVEEIKWHKDTAIDLDYYKVVNVIENKEILKASCLRLEELEDYLQIKNAKNIPLDWGITFNLGYAWYIDNLVPFNEPMELNDFHKIGFYKYADLLYEDYLEDGYSKTDAWSSAEFEAHLEFKVTHAPSTYCYVEGTIC